MSSTLLFADMRIDLANECVWRGEQALKLTPTAFALLRYLVEHAGRLVTKDELLQAVWPETAVTEGVLTTHVRQIRQALEDDPKAPQFIETVHRRGYRFIAPLTTTQPVSSSKFQVSGSGPALRTPHAAIGMVGREAELAQLHTWLEKVLQGEQQIVFVTGEPGIGKTTLVEAFVASLRAENTVWGSRGQCIEHYGTGEPYLPVLEALGRLCREPDGQRLIEILSQHAPSWLVQMPALLSPADLEALQRKTQGATRERMLRELAEAMEVLTAERPLVLWLEDLQWSDVSTLDWLAFVTRRQERARLLVIGTYRPVDVIVSEHPLKAVKQELQLHGQCAELPLGLLSEEAVAEYLAMRFPVGARGQWKGQAEAAHLRKLAHLIHRRTDGNPLFMVNVIDYLLTQGVLRQSEGRWELKGGIAEVTGRVPESLRQMIEQQIERLSPEERRVLEVASVVGAEFSAAAVAAGIGVAVEEVEEGCTELARREQFLRARGTSEWPDGTLAARYSFLHALYQEVLYERVTAGRRARLHQRIGEQEERGYGERAREVAAELAIHFERGRDYRKAVQYLQQAGENAMQRSAHQEAISLLTKGLELLKTLPDTPERAQQELTLQIAFGAPLQATKGWAAPEAERVYARARELCQQVGKTPQLFPALFGLWLCYTGRVEHGTARELAEQCLALAQREQDPALLLQAHHTLWTTLFYFGELTSARKHAEQGMALYNLQQHRSHASVYGGHDPGTCCRNFAAGTLWLLGYTDQALQRSREALTLAHELTHPHSLALALYWAAELYQFRREGQTAQKRAEVLITLSTEQRFQTWVAQGSILRGWALAEQGQGQEEEGIVQMRRGLAAYRTTGTDLFRPHYLALLAEAYGKVGQTEEGLSVLAEARATVDKTGECWYEAELYRLKGQFTLQSKTPSPRSKVKTRLGKSEVEKEAEECFWKAIEIARRQQAKSLELRAVMSLSRLWQQQGKTKQAHTMLAEIYGWFTEGFDTADLQEARALLEELL